MPHYKYRELQPTAEAETVFTRWIAHLDAEFSRHHHPELRSEIVRDELHQLYLGRPHGGKLNSNMMTELPINVLQLTLDPRNVTLEPEYYGDVNAERYATLKPLIWFWQMFDRSPVGLNHWLGFRFRSMLGRHIFKHIGKNVKIFHGVEFSFGYNLTIEDNCTIHKYVLLDDRGEIVVREGSSISDYANVYSHTHDIRDSGDVTNHATIIGPKARVTYHATVLAGTKIGEDAMLGAMGLATHDVPPSTVSAGIPARVIRRKGDLAKASLKHEAAEPTRGR